MPDNETPTNTATAPIVESNTAPTETQDTSVDESSTEGEPEVTAPVTPKEAARIKKLKLKVDGKDYEETVNLDDDEYLTRNLQLAKAAQKRMGEYAALERDVKSFIEALKKDPAKVLADPTIGIDVKQFAAKVIEQQIENAKKSPAQLEKERLEAELKELKDQQKKQQEEFQQREFQRLQEQAYENYDI